MSVVGEPPEIRVDDGLETAYLGRYDPLEAPIILEALRERGIFAMTKSPLDHTLSDMYPTLPDDRGVILVDASRVAEARRLVAEEVPGLIEALRAGLESADEEPATPADRAPFGWLEPAVARELLVQLADAGIDAGPEYPLDAPAPPYARADGRVRVHVEEIFLDEAAEILEAEVREELARRGVSFAEPLRGSEDA